MWQCGYVETMCAKDVDIEHSHVLVRCEGLGWTIVHVACVVHYRVELSCGRADVFYGFVDGVLVQEVDRD